MTRRSVGVEEELLVVDAKAGTPRPLGDPVVAKAQADGEAPDGGTIEHELKLEQVELNVPPSKELAETREHLVRLRRSLAEAAAHHGAGVAALATSPLPVDPTTTPHARYATMAREYALMARDQLTCGCHVHVAVDSREEGVAVLDRIRPWLSVVAALSANSPFWSGVDTGYASYRRMLWDRWPASGPFETFGSVEIYDRAVDSLVTSGVLLDPAMVYFDARLSARYPTVEIRVADVCLEVDDAVAVAGLCRALVETAAQQWQAGVEPAPARMELLRGAAWRAARSGLTGDLVDVVAGAQVPAPRLVHRLVDHVRAALQQYSDEDAVEQAVRRILTRGTGAQTQRAAHRRRGRLADVTTDAVARTCRA